jgi:hypothetical protein
MAVFSFVSKDGTVHHATAVWVQDETVCFITPEGTRSKGAKAAQRPQRAAAGLRLEANEMQIAVVFQAGLPRRDAF